MVGVSSTDEQELTARIVAVVSFCLTVTVRNLIVLTSWT